MQKIDLNKAKATLNKVNDKEKSIRDTPVLSGTLPQDKDVDVRMFKAIDQLRLARLGISVNKAITLERLEKFREHATNIITNPRRLAEEYRLARKYAEGVPGYKKRITKNSATIEERNRYCNIMTLEDTRVNLSPILGEEKKDNDNDYINASYIKDNINDDAAYIATQGPMTNTACDFWRMCIEQNVSIILMLTRFNEGGRIKVDHYFPKDVGGRETFENPLCTTKVTVTCISKEAVKISKDKDSFVKRIFEVKQSFDNVKLVNHFHFKEWPDFGNVGQTSTLLSLLDKMEEAMMRNGSHPMVTHCSAGVGRTGTYLAIDIIRRNLQKDSNYSIDVRQVVSDLRNQRPLMVMTVEQYAMIYRALLLWLFDEALKPSIKKQTEILEDEEMYRNGMDGTA